MTTETTRAEANVTVPWSPITRSSPAAASSFVIVSLPADPSTVFDPPASVMTSSPPWPASLVVTTVSLPSVIEPKSPRTVSLPVPVSMASPPAPPSTRLLPSPASSVSTSPAVPVVATAASSPSV